jgi:NAD(P)-dependent dehydrogenase (short-subunit alcohol dehydrogenase family)
MSLPSWILLGAGALFWAAVGAWLLASVGRRMAAGQRLDVRGRWVLVTGCDSGLGLGVVEQLHAHGVRVVACTYTQDGAKRATAAGAEWAPSFDLCDAAALREVVAEVDRRSGGELFGLVHNAGVALPGFIEYLPESHYRKRPKLRYLSGTLAKTLFRALWIMPERWSARFKERFIRPLSASARAARATSRAT